MAWLDLCSKNWGPHSPLKNTESEGDVTSDIFTQEKQLFACSLVWNSRFLFSLEHPVVKAEKFCVTQSAGVKLRRKIFMGTFLFLSFSLSRLFTGFISWLHTPYLINIFQTLQPWSSILWCWLRPAVSACAGSKVLFQIQLSGGIPDLLVEEKKDPKQNCL